MVQIHSPRPLLRYFLQITHYAAALPFRYLRAWRFHSINGDRERLGIQCISPPERPYAKRPTASYKQRTIARREVKSLIWFRASEG
jgi:hypothetical protein